MKLPLPSCTPFGALVVEEVLATTPPLLVAGADDVFIFHAVDVGPRTVDYVAVRVARDQLKVVRSAACWLRAAFVALGHGVVYRVRCSSPDGSAAVQPVRPHELTDRELPTAA